MKRDATKVLPPDHKAYSDAMEALQRYHEAKDSGATSDDIERLRILAESLFQSVNDYQLLALGGPDYTRH